MEIAESEDLFLTPCAGRSVETRQTYTLQPLALTQPVLEQHLYFKGFGFWDAVERGDGLFLEQGCAIDCDTLINTFFEWHWQRAAGCGACALVIEAEGAGEVHVDHIGPRGERKRIVSQLLKTGRTVVALPRSASAAGRFSCSFGGRDGGLLLRRAAWATDRAASRRTDVCVVICTFDKVGSLAPALETLCREVMAIDAIRRVIVVDQGTDLIENALGPAALAARDAGCLGIVRQENLGGSGGFTRGIVEATRDGRSPCSDILLMDDDVCFEPRLLHRFVALLQRVPADTMVGGSMLDMTRPHHLFAYVERFDPQIGHVIRSQPHGLDMRCGENLSKFEGAGTGNYNGWFICSIPRSACEQNGLPMPFFVRTDDCEFGLRLTAAGVPLTHMPGLFVWHEPFWQKPRAWIEYYTFRNHYILANLADAAPCKSLIWRRLNEFWHYVTTYQYGLALAVCLAFEHYLEGPERVFSDVQARHRQIMPLFATFEGSLREGMPGKVDRALDCPAPGGETSSRFHPNLPMFVRVVANGWWTLFGRRSPSSDDAGTVLVQQAVAASKLSWDTFHEYPLVLVDLPNGSSDLLRHDARVARTLVKRMLGVIARMLVRSTTLQAAYRRSVSQFGSYEAWRLTFNQPN